MGGGGGVCGLGGGFVGDAEAAQGVVQDMGVAAGGTPVFEGFAGFVFAAECPQDFAQVGGNFGFGVFFEGVLQVG